MNNNHVVMVYPRLGFSGSYVQHMPLGLLYASSEIVKHDYEVSLLDTRLVGSDWPTALADQITDETLCVGISVMSGTPIHHAIEIGRHVKAIAPHVAVVWGGPHATFYPDTILRDEWSCDYVISGYAAKPFHQLCDALRLETDLANVGGLVWRNGSTIQINPPTENKFEIIDHRDIPYDLIEDFDAYGQLGQQKRIFSMYSAVGCPYKCSFCSSPAQYKPIEGKKWIPIEVEKVADHVQYVVEEYGADYVYFIDDDSFPSLKNVEALMDEIKSRNLDVGLGFRGARINEILRMSDEFLEKLVSAGTDIMHIGAESGSNPMLELIRKDCTVDDIIEANRKLARHPKITAAYNIIMGLPTETLDDIKKTRDLIFQLVEDNPNCIIFQPNKFRPLPGTELYDLAAKEWGYQMPDTLEAWAGIEVEADNGYAWHDPAISRFCNLMLVSSYFVDNKIKKLQTGNQLLYRFARVANFLYGPIARFRLRHGLDRAYFEWWLYQYFTHLFSKMTLPAGAAGER